MVVGILLTALAAFLGSGWAGRGIVWTFLLSRTQQLDSLRRQRDRLKRLHDTGGISGWLLSGILWVVVLCAWQLMLEGLIGAQLTRSPPPEHRLLIGLLNLSRYTVGFITMLVSVNRLTWYRRLEHYKPTMDYLDRVIARLDAKQALYKPPGAV